MHGLRIALALAIVELDGDADDHQQAEDDEESQRRRATARRRRCGRRKAGGRRRGRTLRPGNAECHHGAPPYEGRRCSNLGARRLVGTAFAARSHTMRVIIEGLGEDRALRTLVNGKIAASLGRLHVPATTARVQFSNETSAKGGPTARCSITVDLPRRPELHADVTGESTRLAFEQAFAMLERQIERDRERGREERRRPKKYYLAKRLLEPGASSQEPPARAVTSRRVVRRRTA
ncbi:MAG: hypothetical protein DMD85_02070 [Candidatus Rokuibacteriota bacterium]|nr:MAG: hypothetical protein DMD85_02070 [Candidatus Rokubacteria bacterium]